MDMTSESGPLEQDSWDRTSGTGQLGQDSRDKTVSVGQPHRQPGQISLERIEMTGLSGPDSGVRRAVANVAWAGNLEQALGTEVQRGQDRCTR
jgi:hypothetical protein